MRYFASTVLMTVILASCSSGDTVFIQTDPIANADDAETFMATFYSDLESNALFRDAFVVMPLLFSDQAKYVGTQNSSWDAASKFNLSDATSGVQSMYDAFYALNSKVHYMEAEMDTTDDASLPDDVKDGFRAEARALRALSYFYLTRFWGNVPLIIDGSSDVDSLVTNATRQELFDQMESDLLFAEQHIANQPYITNNQRMNELAVKAMLARLYLAYGNYAQALIYAEAVIGDGGAALDTDVESIYTISSPEHIWVLPESRSGLSLALYFLQSFSNGQYEVRPRTAIPFEAGDARRDFALSVPGTTILKYDDISGNSDPVYMIRIAEMYLLAAEAAVQSSGDFDKATGYVNEVRHRAGLGDVAVNADNFKEVLLQERNAELCYEGYQRLDDLRRFGDADVVLGDFGYDDRDALWPFPANALDKYESLVQNEGY